MHYGSACRFEAVVQVHEADRHHGGRADQTSLQSAKAHCDKSREPPLVVRGINIPTHIIAHAPDTFFPAISSSLLVGAWPVLIQS